MIFVTVGTHEQPFNRLIDAVDVLRGTGVIDEPVIIQTGFSTYEPQHCEWHKLLPYSEMMEKVAEARIVITHGGPASFIMPLQIGKIPIVVPRQLQFNEHVNDHQVDFTKAVAERMGNIIPIYNIAGLSDVISQYDEIVMSMQNMNLSSNTGFFCAELEKIANKLYSNKTVGNGFDNMKANIGVDENTYC